MSDDDNYYPRHLLWALNLLNSDEESEDSENANVDDENSDLFASDDENEGSNEGYYSDVLEEASNTQYPYLYYALGLGDFPEENETSEDNDMESYDVLTSDDESEVNHEESDSQDNEENDNVNIYVESLDDDEESEQSNDDN